MSNRPYFTAENCSYGSTYDCSQMQYTIQYSEQRREDDPLYQQDNPNDWTNDNQSQVSQQQHISLKCNKPN